MRKLYYTVERGGWRTISVYIIENNEPKLWLELNCEDYSVGSPSLTDEEEIQNWLDDNGYGDETFEMIQL